MLETLFVDVWDVSCMEKIRPALANVFLSFYELVVHMLLSCLELKLDFCFVYDTVQDSVEGGVIQIALVVDSAPYFSMPILVKRTQNFLARESKFLSI